MKPAYATILVAGALLSPIFAHAGPSDYIYTPTVEYGEKEICRQHRHRLRCH